MPDDSKKLLTELTDNLYEFIRAEMKPDQYGVIQFNVGLFQRELRAYLKAAFEYGTTYEANYHYHGQAEDKRQNARPIPKAQS